MGLHNLARVETETTGTGTITLGAAVSGFLTFALSGVVDGEKVYYGIADGANSEVGIGTYTHAGTTLSRDTVLASTNTGSKINLSGTAQVYITAAAENFSGVYPAALPATDLASEGIKTRLTAHQDQLCGDVCFIASDGQAQIADADALATAGAIVMAVESPLANTVGDYLLIGTVRRDTWTWTVGGLIYLSTTGTTLNTMTQTAPSGANDVIQVLGVALTADSMLFNPSLAMVEHV